MIKTNESILMRIRKASIKGREKITFTTIAIEAIELKDKGFEVSPDPNKMDATIIRNFCFSWKNALPDTEAYECREFAEDYRRRQEKKKFRHTRRRACASGKRRGQESSLKKMFSVEEDQEQAEQMVQMVSGDSEEDFHKLEAMENLAEEDFEDFLIDPHDAEDNLQTSFNPEAMWPF